MAFWKAGAVSGDPIPDTESQAKARAIMGKYFLGLEEVRRGYGGVHTEKQRCLLAEIPYNEEMLHACKDTHVLVAGSVLSLNDIRKLADSDFYDTNWYNREPFANDKKVSVRWYLLRKEPVPESRSKTYDQQTALLKEEEVPFACEVTYMVILYWLTHREPYCRKSSCAAKTRTRTVAASSSASSIPAGSMSATAGMAPAAPSSVSRRPCLLGSSELCLLKPSGFLNS